MPSLSAMNDKYEMARPSVHGSPGGFYVSRPKPFSKSFYVNSALLVAVVAICILVGVLGKRVHDKTLKCEAEKEAAVSCDLATTTQKVIDGVAQCVPVLSSCGNGEVSKAGVCESKKTQPVPAWKWVVLCAVLLVALPVVFRRKGGGRGGGRDPVELRTLGVPGPTTSPSTSPGSASAQQTRRVHGPPPPSTIEPTTGPTEIDSNVFDPQDRSSGPPQLPGISRARNSLANNVGSRRVAAGAGLTAAAVLGARQFMPNQLIPEIPQPVPVGGLPQFGTRESLLFPEILLNPDADSHDYVVNENGEIDSTVPEFGERYNPHSELWASSINPSS